MINGISMSSSKGYVENNLPIGTKGFGEVGQLQVTPVRREYRTIGEISIKLNKACIIETKLTYQQRAEPFEHPNCCTRFDSQPPSA